MLLRHSSHNKLNYVNNSVDYLFINYHGLFTPVTMTTAQLTYPRKKSISTLHGQNQLMYIIRLPPRKPRKLLIAYIESYTKDDKITAKLVKTTQKGYLHRFGHRICDTEQIPQKHTAFAKMLDWTP